MMFVPVFWARMRIYILSVVISFICFEIPGVSQTVSDFQYKPEVYICQSVGEEKSPSIDGVLDEVAWNQVAWTNYFVDIEGDRQPKPRLQTRCKMTWDSTYFYIAAVLEEPHLWATYDKHDMVIFHENDFELFLDPDGDTHGYMELEINALATHWDLMLTKPYRDGGRPIDAWDVQGLKKSVQLLGTLNQPNDTDTAWIVEMALPWRVLEEANSHNGPPHAGEAWKVNFSRVQWDLDIIQGKYRKKVNAATRKDLPEHNWVWSPQGRIDMHQPESWGLVIFADSQDKGSIDQIKKTDALKRALRKVYADQQAYFREHNTYFSDFSTYTKQGITGFSLGSRVWLASICVDQSCFYINQDGKVWH
jgi:hypothetical protein